MKKEQTPVIFRAWKESGNVIALFPTIAADYRNSVLCQSYEHVGQHGAASIPTVMGDSRPATEAEYAPLLKELETIGYENLVIRQRISPKMMDELKKNWVEINKF